MVEVESWKRRVEHQIVSSIIKESLLQGYRITVSYERGFDMEEMLLGSTNPAEIIEAVFAADECHIFIHPKDGELLDEQQRLNSLGWIYIVLGNDGWDAICDYTTNLDELGVLVEALNLADEFAR